MFCLRQARWEVLKCNHPGAPERGIWRKLMLNSRNFLALGAKLQERNFNLAERHKQHYKRIFRFIVVDGVAWR
jgi:hypothetical protein